MKIIAFAGSNSSKSINQQLATYAASLTPNTEVIQLTDYNTPIYSEDAESETGIPESIQRLNNKLSAADGFIIAVNEHNGNISAFFKNILDWLSRNQRDFLKDKKVVLLSTSPGGRGGASAIGIAQKTLPYFGATVVGTISIGNFYDVFKNGELIDSHLAESLKQTTLKLL